MCSGVPAKVSNTITFARCTSRKKALGPRDDLKKQYWSVTKVWSEILQS